MRYEYSALTTEGKSVSGWIDMPDAAAVTTHLQLQGLLPIDAVERSRGQDRTVSTRVKFAKQLPSKDLILTTRQLSRLAAAGLPLDRALQIIIGLLRTRRSRDVVQAIHADVSDGASLSDAMSARVGAFPAVVLAMVGAGEQGGVIAPVLGRAAEFLERAAAIRQSIISALIYPAILATVAGFAIVIVLTAVLPEFEPMFQEAGARLPLITRVVIAISNGIQHLWWLCPITALILVFSWKHAMTHSGAKWFVAGAVLQLPVIGTLATQHDAARFARTLSALLANGVSSERALSLAAGVVQNAVIASTVREATEQLKRGEGLSGPLQATNRLPVMLVQLARVGEETGRLPDLLSEAAGLLEAEAQLAVGRLLSLLVPALTIIMGGIIAAIVAAVLLAMLSVNALAS